MDSESTTMFVFRINVYTLFGIVLIINRKIKNTYYLRAKNRKRNIVLTIKEMTSTTGIVAISK